MKNEKNGKKNVGGRPRLELDERQIKELASMQCTLGEIAAVMGCSEDTLERGFAGVIRQGREIGRTALRRAQWNKAVKEGNPQLLVWLGRFYLSQKEEFSLSTSEPDVRALLSQWEISAKKKSVFDKAKDQKIVDMSAA